MSTLTCTSLKSSILFGKLRARISNNGYPTTWSWGISFSSLHGEWACLPRARSCLMQNFFHIPNDAILKVLHGYIIN